MSAGGDLRIGGTPVALVMAGGTGGHVFPGLAVAEVLRERGWRIVWLGNRTGMEAELVPRHGIAMQWIDFGGLRGKGLLTKLLLPLRLLRAFVQAIGVLRRVRPAVVLGLGGYVSFPGGMMAALLGRPLVVHEQNSVAGLANRVLAGVADRTLAAFPGVLPRAEWVGNPLRAALRELPPPEARYGARSGPLRLLVIGGSLGARALNELVPAALALIESPHRPRVTHQSGRSQREALAERYRAAGVQAEVLEFIDDMAAAYAEADLVLCRAGAMTVAELAAVGVASVLVPFPHAVDDHQTTNARFLSERGAALLEPQAQLTAERLARLIEGFTRESLAGIASQARGLAKPDAAERVADVCMELARA